MNRPSRRPFGSTAAILLIAACASREEAGEPRSTPKIGPGDCGTTCSADGRAVVDCHSEVVATCGGDATCSEGMCVDGCEVAAREQSSVGCEYYAAKPSAYTFGFDAEYAEASCYAVLVANTWSSPVELEVEYDGQPIASSYFRIPRGRGEDIRYDLLPDGKLPRGELAVLFLGMHPEMPPRPPDEPMKYIPCPGGAGIVGATSVRGSGYGKMFHIRSSAPVIAYDIYPYGGAKTFIPSSSLLLPTSAWSTEGIVMSGYSTTSAKDATAGLLPYFQVLAREDDTHVEIKPTGIVSSAAGHPQLARGETGEFVLQRGQFLQFTQVSDVSGTGVSSDKPMALVGGATCMNIPNNVAYCDTLHQHLPPLRLYGDTYAAARYRDREDGERERTPWRIVAAADGTKLTYDPPIPEAPATLERGEWKEFWTSEAFVVKSQDSGHPIHVVSYMTGCNNISTFDGDPEMVNVVPVGQYLSSYLFLTDPTYGNTHLVFVRDASAGEREDIELDCVGKVEGWTKIGESAYELARVDLVRKGLPVGSCDNGVHRATSKKPFSLTVWGWDRTASYGFPAGMATRTLNELPAIR